MTTDNNPSLALRVTVSSGGCHGFQYLMALENVSLGSNATNSMTSPSIKATDTDADLDADETDGEAGDTVFEDPFGNNARVVMNEPSLRLLRGSRVDYTEELIGSQFKIVGNPRASSSCGCGTSFDVEF